MGGKWNENGSKMGTERRKMNYRIEGGVKKIVENKKARRKERKGEKEKGREGEKERGREGEKGKETKRRKDKKMRQAKRVGKSIK